MNRIFLLLSAAVALAAQTVPGRYIVEFQTEPAVAVTAARGVPFSPGEAEVQARRAQIQASHTQAEAAIRSLGGTVTHRFDTVLNGLAVQLTEQAAARLRQTPGVKAVYPVSRHHARLDHAVNVHGITQAWQTLASGQAGAGAGIKIGILDTGIDIAHPGFKGFTTAIPAGFPVVSSNTEMANTNNKVIVSRVYSDIAGGVDNSQSSGIDVLGHGTGVAMAAAGMSQDIGQPGVGPLAGVAPGAWLGNYKVADDTGASDTVTFVAGLEDAVKDGMNVVNYSSGGPVISSSDENGPEATAIANAVSAGTLVVTVAGNDGQFGTIQNPGAAAAAITVGSNENERFLWNALTLGNLPPYLANVPDSETGVVTGLQTGPVIDVAAIDGNGYGCSAFPANSLTNQVALIERGPAGAACTYEVKLNNAQNAGAQAAVIYNNVDGPVWNYTASLGEDGRIYVGDIGAATLPVVFIGLHDGQDLKAQVKSNPGIQATIDFDGYTPLPYPANIVSDFSSAGPSPLGKIKPDLLAVGDNFITADATANGSFPYVYSAGTSFSGPLVTGSVALLMAARPGLTASQYKSLIVNSAPQLKQYTNGTIAPPQLGGTGILSVGGALQSTLAAAPTSLNFQSPLAGGGSSSSAGEAEAAAPAGNVSETITVTNVGPSSDTYSVAVNSLDNNAVPVVDAATFTLASHASRQITVTLNTTSLAAGQYHGFLSIMGTQTQVPARIAYWYGVAGTSVKNISILANPGVSSTGLVETIIFRCTDLIGTPLDPPSDPVVTTSNARARVRTVSPMGDIPGTFSVDVVIGRPDATGLNTFTIAAGGTTVAVPIVIQ